ncbi:MAG: hypothetical protein EOO89_09875, partial [Pedobacter sp.]
MKIQRTLFVIALSFASLSLFGQEPVDQQFKKLSWLKGNWERTNTKPGQTGGESWWGTDPLKLAGKGYTIKG